MAKKKTKPKRPSEIFGVIPTPKPPQLGEPYSCPFMSNPDKSVRCTKQSRLISYPMGVCSVDYGGEAIALCPKRFLEGYKPFTRIAQFNFGTTNNIIRFDEVGVPKVGNFDFVLVKHKPMSDEIEDFAAVEFQTGETTGTGKLVGALKEYANGMNITENTYKFGMNYADIWKRTFTQILNKGILMERWKHKIYWVIQEPVYNYFLKRYNLSLKFDPDDNTIFDIYDLQISGGKYEFVFKKRESATVDGLFNVFRNNPALPSKEAFVKRLRNRVAAQLQLSLKLT